MDCAVLHSLVGSLDNILHKRVAEIGLVKGYVAQDLMKIKQENLKYVIDVSLTKKGWRITGLKLLDATSSSSPFANL